MVVMDFPQILADNNHEQTKRIVTRESGIPAGQFGVNVFDEFLHEGWLGPIVGEERMTNRMAWCRDVSLYQRPNVFAGLRLGDYAVSLGGRNGWQRRCRFPECRHLRR